MSVRPESPGPRADPLGFVFEAVVVLAGAWTVACNLAVVAGAGLGTLRVAAALPVLAAGALLAMRPRLARWTLPAEPGPAPRGARLPWPAKLAAAAAVVCLYAATGWLLAFWLAGLAFLALCVLDAKGDPRVGSDAPESPRARTVVLALAAALAALTLVAHRPDVDDAFYLNLAVDAVGHPEWALLAEDWMYGESGWPLQESFYRVGSYELGVATLSSWTGLSPHVLYYLVLPAASAAVVVLVHWLALRALCPRGALAGLVLALLAMLAWGDTHTSYGNFAFVRLFHGKAVLASAGALAVVWLALRWMRRRDAWSWILLALAQIGAMGLSSTGLLVAPLASACALVGSWRPRRDATVSLGVGLLASAYVVAAGLVLAAAGSPGWTEGGWPTEKSLDYVLGDGLRGGLALFALLALPALPGAAPRALGGYLLVAFAALFNPWVGAFASRLGTGVEVAWRLYWSVPFPFLLGALGAVLVTLGPAWRGLRAGAVPAAAFALAFALAPAPWTLSRENRVALDWPRPKVGPGYAIARRAVELTPEGGLVAAPSAVSFWLPTVPGDVRALAVRPGRILRIVERARGAREAEARLAVVDYLDGDRPLPGRPSRRRDDAMEHALRWIDQRGVQTVVVPPYLPSAPGFEGALAERGFARHALADGYRAWTRTQEPAPGPPIVLIVADTLRADVLGCYGHPRDTSPNLDAFAREALVFENARSHGASTWPATASLLTGFLPHETRAVEGVTMGLREEVDSLPEILRRHGYETLAVVGNLGLRARRGWAQGFDVFDDVMEDRELVRGIAERIAPRTTDRAIELLRAHRSDPFFLWVHYQDPHGPYTPPDAFVEPLGSPASGRELPVNDSTSGRGGIPSYQQLGDLRRVADYRARYEGEVRFLDHHVGRLLDELRRLGLYDEALVVFTADHGEDLGEHDVFFSHGENLRDGLTRIPLLVRHGRALRGRRDDLVQHLDVVPTVLAVAGIEADPRLRGRDLRRPAREAEVLALRENGRFSGTPDASLVSGHWKLVCRTREEGRACALYDLARDPGETRDLSGDPSHGEVSHTLRERLEALLAEDRLGIRLEGEPAPLGEKEREALRALGYVE